MYRIIDEAFWNDPKVWPLDTTSKLLLVYLFSNPHCHVSGIYPITPVIIADGMNIPVKSVEKSLAVLSPKFVKYDKANRVIWVRKMFKRQCPNPGQTILKRVENHLPCLYESKLIGEFLQEYSHLCIPYRYPIDGVNRVSYESEKNPSLNDQDNDQDNDTDQDTDSVPDTPSASLQVVPVPDKSKKAQIERIKESLDELSEKFPHLNVREEFNQWQDWMAAKGRTYKDYAAGFRTWCNADWKKPQCKPSKDRSLAERLAQREWK